MKRIHLIAGSLALLIALTNFSSTVIVEIFGSLVAIAKVKQFIVSELIVLVFFMATTGISGFFLKNSYAKKTETINSKRIIITALNGIFILIPAALYLSHLANIKSYGENFIIIQSIELIAGATNIFLMFKNTMTALRIVNHKFN